MHVRRIAQLALLAAGLAGCVSNATLQTMEREWQQSLAGNPCALRTAAAPPATTHGRRWIGQTAEQLRGALGREDFALATPGGQVALCYDATGSRAGPATSGCVESYVLDSCGVITGYSCK